MSDKQATPKTDGRKNNGGARAGAGKPKAHPEDKLKQGAAYLYPRTWRTLKTRAAQLGVEPSELMRKLIETGLSRASDYVEGGGGLLGNTGT